MGLARIRHMPVIDEEGVVVGLVSQRDLFRGALARALGYGEFARQKLYGMLKVKDVMSKEIVTVPSSTPLDEAARIMIDRKIGCLVVVDGKDLVGILTEGDFVRLATDASEGTDSA
jgi:CBS domain-containing protein